MRKEDALNYHQQGQPGKIEVIPTKSLSTQLDLALAYSPGVAEPCKEIAEDEENVYKYTSKGNLVAVISNGTAVLGLGNIGPAASKPVMEGKGVLFKKFAGIDVFDIEVDANDPEEFIKIVKALEPTFGGVNLEDIKAPESFLIEERLRKELNIPVMHDDQHGTAIISAAALLSALEVVEKKIDEIQLVVNGAGASAIACANLYVDLGVKKENIVMLDSKGVIRADRGNLDKYKGKYATGKDLHTLEEAIVGADMFLGLSKGDVLNPEMLKQMAKNPIVFALANPNPEIAYDLAMQTRDDIVMATGRSDHPNQVNNVLGFPYIFRGALDVRATEINEAMKLAAVKAIADLAKEPVPDIVNKAYGDNQIVFGKEYLIPKPLDPRLITSISPAVAKAAMDSGVAKIKEDNWDWHDYELHLHKKMGTDQTLISRIIQRAKGQPKKVIFAEADNQKILKAAQIAMEDGVAIPILLGNKEKIKSIIAEQKLGLENCEVFDPLEDTEKATEFAHVLYEKRKRKGVTFYDAKKKMRDRNYFGLAMLELGLGDALISGLTKNYPQVIRPALEVIGKKGKVVAGMYILQSKGKPLFLADTTINNNPNVEELVEIIGLAKEGVEFFAYKPRMAMLSYSNFGSSQGPTPSKMAAATKLSKQKYQDLVIDGDIQANVALHTELIKENYPFSELADKGANTLIFPHLSAGNIAYKLLQEVGNLEATGPLLLGMNKPVHILQLGSSVREIVNMVAIAVVDAQNHA